jgi:ABC-type molybdate transport system substrate-binding protein
MMGLLLSNKKFSNTLEKILENDNNLNVIIGDDAGIIYNSDSDKYEPISKNELFKLTMDKIYGHLKDFYDSIIEDTDKNKFFNKDTTLLNSEMDSINTNYNRYYYKSPYFRSNADEAIEYLYNVIKKEAEKIFIEKNEKQPNNITM